MLFHMMYQTPTERKSIVPQDAVGLFLIVFVAEDVAVPPGKELQVVPILFNTTDVVPHDVPDTD